MTHFANRLARSELKAKEWPFCPVLMGALCQERGQWKPGVASQSFIQFRLAIVVPVEEGREELDDDALIDGENRTGTVGSGNDILCRTLPDLMTNVFQYRAPK